MWDRRHGLHSEHTAAAMHSKRTRTERSPVDVNVLTDIDT